MRLSIFATVAGLSLSLSATAHAAGSLDFDRYRIILIRQPFGIEATPSAPGASNAAPAFVSGYRVTGLVRGEDGVFRVGLTDNKTKKNYLLPVGEEEDGILIVDADYEGERARVRHEGRDYWISMSGVMTPAWDAPDETPSLPAAPSDLSGGTSALSQTPPQRSGVPTLTATGTPTVARSGLSYAERRRLREAERLKRREAQLRAELELARAAARTNAAAVPSPEEASKAPLTTEELIEALRAYGVTPSEQPEEEPEEGATEDEVPAE